MRVLTVAVGGLNQHGVRCRCPVGRLHDEVIGATQIAREKNAASRHFQQHAGRTQNVTRMRESGAPAGDGLEGVGEIDGLDQRQTIQRVLLRVQRQGRRMFGKTMAVGKGRVFFLNVAAIG